MTIRYHDGTQWQVAAPERLKVFDPVASGWVPIFSPPVIAGALPDGEVGTPYSATLTVDDGVAQIAITSATLPTGLTASIVNRTITVEGTP